jgi:hypothetical protein
VFLFGNVGDGFMAALKKNGEAIRIGGSHSGSYSGEVVCFVPDPGVNSYYQSSIEKIAPLPAEEVEAVLICTDGVEDPFFPIDKNIGDMFSQLKDGFHKPVGDVTYPEGCEPKSIVGAPNPGSELLRWLGYEKRGENDDRTAVLIYRNSLAIT